MSDMIRFGEEGILFCDGWYIFTNGKGDYSVISEKSARKKMEDNQEYQASQDVDRAGIDPDIAYPSRGFKRIDGKFVYVGKEIDNLATSPVREIPEILVIPKTIGGNTINYITKDAFYEEKSIKKVVLHEKIKSIEHNAFSGCQNLSLIENVPEWITIGKDSFKNTQIYTSDTLHYLNHVLIKAEPSVSGKIVVKEGTHVISDNAFENCKEITQVILPQSIRKIGACAFQNCINLESIQFPAQMDFIGENAFYGCIKLDHVEIPKGVQFLRTRTFENCESLADIQIPLGIRLISYNTFCNTAFMNRFLSSDETELYLNDWLIHYKYDCKKVLKVRPGTIGIADMDWSDTKALGGLVLPEGLKYIGSDAFRMRYLSFITLPEGLLTIGRAAFRHTLIGKIIIPESVKKIDAWAFMDCKCLRQIIVTGKDTEVIWPAITGYGDKTIVAYPNSSAHEYCKKYGEKYSLHFVNIKEYKKG